MGQTQSQFDPAHTRIYTNILGIRDPRVRHQMISTVLQGPEYVFSAKRAGIYAHLLAYQNAVERGLDLPPLPGEYANHRSQGGNTVVYQGHQGQQTYSSQQQMSYQQQNLQHSQHSQLIQHTATQRSPVQVLAKKKASAKALSFFSSCLKVLNIEEEVALTDELLRSAYKKAVIRAHPDRGGSEEHFEAVTRAYAYLTDILHLIQGNKTKSTAPVPELDTVKQQRNTVAAQVQHVEPVRLNPKNLNMNAFNQMFEETRVPDPDEDGYGDWLKGEDNRGSSQGARKFGKEFNRDVFNSMFENEVKRESSNTHLALRQPEALVATNAVELGRDRPPDYTAGFNSKTNFTDLKSAYTKDNTFSNQVSGVVVESRSFEGYKTQREKGPAVYSADELSAIDAWNKQQEMKEKQRQLRAAQESISANDYHERMKRLVIRD